jgi:hypothetical protein
LFPKIGFTSNVKYTWVVRAWAGGRAGLCDTGETPRDFGVGVVGVETVVAAEGGGQTRAFTGTISEDDSTVGGVGNERLEFGFVDFVCFGAAGVAYSRPLSKQFLHCGTPSLQTNSVVTSEHSWHIKHCGWNALPSRETTAILPTLIIFSHHKHGRFVANGFASLVVLRISFDTELGDTALGDTDRGVSEVIGEGDRDLAGDEEVVEETEPVEFDGRRDGGEGEGEGDTEKERGEGVGEGARVWAGVGVGIEEAAGWIFCQQARQHGIPSRHTNSVATWEHSSHIKQWGWNAFPSEERTTFSPLGIIASHHIHWVGDSAGLLSEAAERISGFPLTTEVLDGGGWGEEVGW